MAKDDPYASLGAPVATAPQAQTAPAPASTDTAAPVDTPTQQTPADAYSQVGSDAAVAGAQGDQAAPEGFTAEQKQAIHDYIPHAKDAADLERFSLELSGGRAKIGNAADVIKHRDQGFKTFGWEDPTVSKDMGRQEQPSAVQGVGKALIAHIANGLVADYGPEVGGALTTLLTGGDLSRNVAHERAMLDGESDGHGVASFLGELGGAGLAAPIAAEAAPARIAELPGVVKAGAGGAAYGSGAAGPDHRIEGAVTGAALGAGTDLAAPILIKGVAARAGARQTANAENQAFAQAAGRQGIDYMAADLPNATKSKFATALSNLTIGGIPLADQAAKNVGTAADAVERAAGNIGAVADKTGAGQAAQRGARSFVDSSAKVLDTLEQKIPIPAAAPATVSNTRGALTSLMQSFSSNPKLAAAFKDPKLKAFTEALTPQTSQEATGVLDAAGNPITRDVTHGGGLSWNDLRDFRTRVGQIIGQPGLASDGVQIGQLRSLYGALSDDIRATAKQAGPGAEQAWTRWNNYARARAGRIDNVVSLILGKNNDKAPQSAFEAIQRLGADKGGDPIKLGQALRSMPADEANSVRATILDDLGTASAGNQNAAGTAFSPAEFVTKWNKLSDRAKNILFTGDHRNAINDIVNVLGGMKASSKFANNSKTGIAVIASTHTLPALIANPVLGALDMALQYGSGKLLSSPAIARKIAGTPKSIAGARAYWSRPWVQKLANENPAIAGEIQAFQHAFLSHANDNNSFSAAADSQSEDQNQ